jgi:polynucleotide 5'-hydroxyl-kinase GRC3/NOL9
MTIRVIKAGDIYRVEGPAKVVVRSGQIYATGVIYSEGQSFTVLRARRLAIKAVADAEVEFVLGPGALLEKAAPGEEIIDEWERQISSPRSPRRDVDTRHDGCWENPPWRRCWETRRCRRATRWLLSTPMWDRTTLGPPTTVSMARLTRYVTHLRQLVAEKSIFLQATSLEKIWPRAVEKIVMATWSM